jgi:hypothetical protein
MTFKGPKATLLLDRVNGPSDCDRVQGQGWFFVANVPGVMVEAPIVMTFEVCPEACEKINSAKDWSLSFKLNTCP